MILRLSPTDWERFRRVRLAGLAQDPQAFGSQYAEVAARPQSSWTDQLRDLPPWVVPGEGADLGVVRVAPGAPPELISLWVSPAGRGRGLGRRLVQQVLDWSRAEGALAVALSVKCDNDHAIGLYRAMGFVPHGAVVDGEQGYRLGLSRA